MEGKKPPENKRGGNVKESMPPRQKALTLPLSPALYPLSGSYVNRDGRLIGESGEFLIRERKNPQGKPPLYLYQLSPLRRYISSLYEVADGVYRLEFEGVYYRLVLRGGKAWIWKTDERRGRKKGENLL